MKLWPWLLFILAVGIAQADDIEKISLPLIPDLQRADVYIFKGNLHPAAILVLCPGFNGNGEDWIKDPAWQEFARQNDLGLAGLSFASDGDLLKRSRGYYYPEQGSGLLLIDGLHKAFDPDVPLLLYGFSGGAHFTSGFVEWKPARVLGWCAYSAEWWENPSNNNLSPPGIVACGDEDERYGASLIYFKQGRALNKPWLWISVPKNRHAISPPVENFVRHYFAALLETHKSAASGQWVDIDFKTKAEEATIRNQPSLTGWLPDAKLLPEWQAIHQP